MQLSVDPFKQCGQDMSLKMKGAITRSPTARSSTSAPTASTVPMNSWPMEPTVWDDTPRQYQRSEPQTQASTTRTMASVGSWMVGSGRSATSIEPGPLKIAARMGDSFGDGSGSLAPSQT